jgi:hypothetical protein
MTLRKGHGNGAGEPRIEVSPADELPAPVPGEPAPVRRRRDGTVADAEAAKELGRKGGRRKAERRALTSALGLTKLDHDAAFAPYRTTGDLFVEQHLAELARVAGGNVGPGPASIVATAAVQLTASRFFSDKAMQSGDPSLFSLASSLGNASRQNLLAAYELAVREASARRDIGKSSVLVMGGTS